MKKFISIFIILLLGVFVIQFYFSKCSKINNIVISDTSNDRDVSKKYIAMILPREEVKRSIIELFSKNIDKHRAKVLLKKVLTIVKHYSFNKEAVNILTQKLLPALKVKFSNDKELIELINMIEKNVKIKSTEYA